MRGIHLSSTTLPQQIPARGHDGRRVVLSDETEWRQVPSERRAVIEYERNAVVGVSRSVQDFSGKTDLIEHRAALGNGDCDIAVHAEIKVVIRRLDPLLHERDRWDLQIEHE